MSQHDLPPWLHRSGGLLYLEPGIEPPQPSLWVEGQELRWVRSTPGFWETVGAVSHTGEEPYVPQPREGPLPVPEGAYFLTRASGSGWVNARDAFFEGLPFVAGVAALFAGIGSWLGASGGSAGGAAASGAGTEAAAGAAVDLTAEQWAAGLTAEQIAGTAPIAASSPGWLDWGADLAKKWASGRVLQSLAPDRPVDVAAAAAPPIAPGGVAYPLAPQYPVGGLSVGERQVLMYGGLGLVALLVVAMVVKK